MPKNRILQPSRSPSALGFSDAFEYSQSLPSHLLEHSRQRRVWHGERTTVVQSVTAARYGVKGLGCPSVGESARNLPRWSCCPRSGSTQRAQRLSALSALNVIVTNRIDAAISFSLSKREILVKTQKRRWENPTFLTRCGCRRSHLQMPRRFLFPSVRSFVSLG